MNTTKTFGPWQSFEDCAGDVFIISAGDVQRADCFARVLGSDRIARGRLIAAAPELLELLRALTFTAETVAHLRGLEREILPTTDKARALIAQIEG